MFCRDMRPIAVTAGTFAALALALAACSNNKKDAEQSHRAFSFHYQVEVPAIPEGTGPVDLFIPLARSDGDQRIVKRSITASIDGEEQTERKYGNTLWHGHVAKSDGKPITVRVDYTVERSVFSRGSMAADAQEHTAAEREQLAMFLAANDRVPISGDLIEEVRADLPKNDGTPLGRARAIYDYVIDTMEYKKVGSGWGNGDTYWACSQRYGNCTDFHALFISLARAEGIPTRFEIGFPVPLDKPSGTIGGYHCWVEFHIAGIGWIPVDASEAWKHPEHKDLLFGTQPADRFQLTVGRDLELGDGHTSGSLNYFVYPHLEIDGAKSDEYTTEFTYDAE
jgi:transglutaminase-like putative cysteine protease